MERWLEMKFYDKDRKQFVKFGEAFIQQYAEAYYYPESGKSDQPLVKGLSRCSHYPEPYFTVFLNSDLYIIIYMFILQDIFSKNKRKIANR